jgi:uncharacterized protein YjiS (DUF1127 family)
LVKRDWIDRAAPMETQMALVDFAPTVRPAPSAYVVAAIHSVVSWIAAVRAERARQLTLRSLLEMDAHRLDDLGISPHDVTQAMDQNRAVPASHWPSRK